MSRQVGPKWPLLLIAVAISSLILGNGLLAQPANNSVLVASVTDNGIEVYSTDSAGQQTLVTSLPEFRVGEPVDANLWYMENASRLTVSLDGTKLAFTAQRAGEWALFIYDLGTGALQETPIASNQIATWSPDSRAILIAYATAPMADDFVYELDENHLFQLTNSTDFGDGVFGWLPDSSGLFYVGIYSECENCLWSEALYYVSRDGSETRLLAIGDALALPDSFGSICDPTWSEPNQRIYFIIGCTYEDPYTNQYLYSVDLTGNTRVETSGGLNSLFPDETAVRAKGIHPSPLMSNVFVTVHSDGSPEGPGNHNWRIMELSAPDDIVMVYEESSDDNLLKSSAMSPDGTSIALLTNEQAYSVGIIEVIYLATGQRTIGSGATPLEVCEVNWADDHTLFFTVDPTGTCYLELAPQSVWALDTASGATQEVSSGLSGNLSIVRQVEMTSPLAEPPTPTETPTPIHTPTPSLPLVNGIVAELYANTALEGTPAVTRLDPQVAFNWLLSDADPAVGSDFYSIRWSGLVEPLYDEEYTFTLGIDDGARLWIDGQLIIDQWIEQGYTEHSGAITLAAGQRVPIVVEYFENEGAAAVNLFWESASQPREIIPQARLFAYSDLPLATATPTITPSHTPTDTPTATPTLTPSDTPTPTFTPSPAVTPTPAPYQTLLLTSMCSPDPASTRVWRARNSNPYPVNFTWDVYGTAQTGSGTVPAASGTAPGEVLFQTVTVGGANTTRIFVNGVLNNTKASSTRAC